VPELIRASTCAAELLMKYFPGITLTAVSAVISSSVSATKRLPVNSRRIAGKGYALAVVSVILTRFAIIWQQMMQSFPACPALTLFLSLLPKRRKTWGNASASITQKLGR